MFSHRFLFRAAACLGLALMAGIASAQAPPAPPQVPLPAQEAPPPQAQPSDRVESVRAQTADLIARVDELLVNATGLLEARLVDVRARAVALERDFRELPDVKGEIIRERYNSARDRSSVMVSKLKAAALDVPPPPAEIDTLIQVAGGIHAEAHAMAQAQIDSTTLAVGYITDVSRLEFDGLRDRVGRLGDDLSRFVPHKAGDLRGHLEIARNVLASSQRDLRTVISDDGVFYGEKLESIADRIAEARDRLADASGHFDDVPRTQLATMRGEAERLHVELRAILEGRVVGGPPAVVRAQRERAAKLSEQLAVVMANKKGPALKHLEAARESVGALHEELGDAIDEKGELLPARLKEARARLSQARSHVVDASGELDQDARAPIDSLRVEMERMDADLTAMVHSPADAGVRAAARPEPVAPR